jgi:hypothetical protein
MGLNVRLYNITNDGTYSIRYKSGDSPYPETNNSTFTLYATSLTATTITITNLSFDTQYWVKMTDETTGRYIIKNIYTHDSKAFPCYDTMCFDVEVQCGVVPSVTPTPTITPTVTKTPTPTPSITPTINPSPSLTPSKTPTPTITPSINSSPQVTPSKTPTPTPTPTPTSSQPLTYCLWYSIQEIDENVQYEVTWTLKNNLGNTVTATSNIPITFYKVNSSGVVTAVYTSPQWQIFVGSSQDSGNITLNPSAGEYLVAGSGQSGTITDPNYCGIAFIDCDVNPTYCI